jgi:endoglucanase
MMKTRLLGAGLVALSLAACSSGGGISGGGGGGGGTVVTPTPTPAVTPTPTPTPAAPTYTPVAAAVPTTGIHIPVGRCVNMGNHLEAPNEGDWGRAIVDADFTIIKAAGFDTVRIPVRWSGHALAAAPYTIDAAFMTRVRHVVDTARAAGLNVLLNMHHYEELFQNPAGHATRFAEMWKQIAAEFASQPNASVWFELINEPNNNLNDTNLLTVLNPALANVRATNATRPVIVGGQNWSGVGSLATLVLPSDAYVVPTIHTYDPFNFTHQGATWVSPTPPLGRTFGSAADYNELNNNLQAVQNYITRTGRVPFVGEYGAIDDPGVPLSERIKYYSTMTSAYASIGIQTCAWGYTNTFRLRDGGSWLPGMLDAIKTTTTLQ